MKLYWSPQSRAVTTLWMMEGAGEPYERVLIDINTGAQKTPEYLAINPMGKVPALQDGEATMAEVSAICAYVADRCPKAKLAPPIGDPRRAKYLQWLFFNPACIEGAITQIVTKLEIPTLVFDVLDKALEKGPFLLGNDFFACDVVIGSGLHYATQLFKIVPQRPSFDRYIARCTARPAFQRAAAIS